MYFTGFLEYNEISMKNNQIKILSIIILSFALFLAGAYILVTGTFWNVPQEIEGGAETGEKTLEELTQEYEESRLERIGTLVRKDLYEDEVGDDEYGIVDAASSVDVSQLLSKTGWGEVHIGVNGLVFAYPVDEVWSVESTDNVVVLTAGNPDNPADEPWARITVGEYDRDETHSLLEWIESVKTTDSVPADDTTIQYVFIGESRFLGSVFFKEHLWTGKKSVYAEISPVQIFSATLEVGNMYPEDELLGQYDQIFYTLLESLEVK